MKMLKTLVSMKNKNNFPKNNLLKKPQKSVHKALQLAYHKIFIHTNSALGRTKFLKQISKDFARPLLENSDTTIQLLIRVMTMLLDQR